MNAAPSHTPEKHEPPGSWRSCVLGANVARLRRRAKINKKTFCLMAVSYTHLDVYKRQRLSTITRADQIAVVDGGSIVALGTHEDLLGSCPLYARMWAAHVGTQDWAAGSNAEGGNR